MAIPSERPSQPPSASPTAGFIYPFYSDRWETTLFIGTLLVITSITIIPAIALLGYCWRIAAHATHDRSPPTFSPWGALFANGLRALLTASVLAGGVALFVGGPLVIARYLLTGYQPTTVTPLPALVSAVTVAAVTVACWGYLLPAAFVHAAAADDVHHGFSFHLLTIVVSPRYFLLWILTTTAFIGMTVTSVLLALLPLAGTFLSALTSFYSLIAITGLFSFGLSIPQNSQHPTG